MSSLPHGLVGIGFWITDIVLLVRTRRDGGVLQANLQALFLSVLGEIACGLTLLPACFGHGQTIALGIAAACVFLANLIVRTLCAVKLGHIPNADPASPDADSAVLSAEKHLSLAAALAGLACFLLGVALLYVISDVGFPAFHEKVLQISQGENGTGAAYFGAAVYIILLLSYLIFAPLQFGSLVFSLCVMIALFSMAAGRKGRHMLGIAIALWIVEAFALFCSALFPAVFPLHPAVIATDVLFFLAWTAQAVLCTVLTARTKRLSKVRSASAAVQNSSLA